MIAIGVLAGAAPLVDYQAAFAGVPVAVYFVAKMRRHRELGRALALAAGGAAVPIAILLGYHAACFGSPLRTGYDVSVTFAHFHRQGLLGITALRKVALWGSLFAVDNGLFALSPWLVLAIPGGVTLWRRGQRGLVATSSAIAIVFVLFVSSINFWRGGWSVGPRYITALVPFLLPLVVSALDAWRTRPLAIAASAGLVVAGIAIYVVAAATLPYWPDALRNPLYEVALRLLGDGAVAPSLATACGISGLVGIAPIFALAFGLAGWAIVQACGWRGLAIATTIAVALLGAYRLVPHGGAIAERIYVQTLYPAVAQ
jgi:hypothetical protein